MEKASEIVRATLFKQQEALTKKIAKHRNAALNLQLELDAVNHTINQLTDDIQQLNILEDLEEKQAPKKGAK